MTRLKFGYSHRNFHKFHRIKRLCGRKGFTIFKPILSDIFLRLTGFGYLTFSSVEACRRVIRRGFKKQVYIFIKVFFFFSLTRKSANSRMGGGKGNPYINVYPLVSGKVLFELFWCSFVKVYFLDWFFRDFFCWSLEFGVLKFLPRVFQKFLFFSVYDKLAFLPSVGVYLF